MHEAMSTLVLVRHGKASAFSPHDYDRLSAPGIAQSRALGRHWGARETRFDRVWVGPRTRHAQTHEATSSIVSAHGVEWPAPAQLDDLDEHHGLQLVFALLPRLATEEPTVATVASKMMRGEAPGHDEILLAYRAVTRRWITGELSAEGVERWSDFRARAERALATMIGGLDRGSKVVAFTSGGAIAAIVGAVLALDDRRVLDLSWALHNGSLTTIVFSEHGTGLESFNATPHLEDPSLVTSV
jgi:broad specificity phosphatase PhoE